MTNRSHVLSGRGTIDAVVASRSCHPVHLWWRKWIWTHDENGKPESRPDRYPTTVFSDLDRNNVRCPASCNKINHCRNASANTNCPAIQNSPCSDNESHIPVIVTKAVKIECSAPCKLLGLRFKSSFILGGGCDVILGSYKITSNCLGKRTGSNQLVQE